MKKISYILLPLLTVVLAGCSVTSPKEIQPTDVSTDTSSRQLTEKECIATGGTAIIYSTPEDVKNKKCVSPQKQIRRIK